MTRQTVTLVNMQQGHAELQRLWAWCKSMLAAEHRLTVEAKPQTRSIRQNAMLWACLTDLSRQVTWFGKRMSPEGWKEFITGNLAGQDLVPNIDGTGFVSIGRGKSTSDMTIREMTDVIDLCHAFGTQQGVQWSPASIAMDLERVE